MLRIFSSIGACNQIVHFAGKPGRTLRICFCSWYRGSGRASQIHSYSEEFQNNDMEQKKLEVELKKVGKNEFNSDVLQAWSVKWSWTGGTLVLMPFIISKPLLTDPPVNASRPYIAYTWFQTNYPSIYMNPESIRRKELESMAMDTFTNQQKCLFEIRGG